MTGSRIRSARLAAGLSLRELARRAYVNPGYLSQVERGLRAPSSALLAAVSHVLDVVLVEPEPLRAALELLTSSVPHGEVREQGAVQQLRLLDDQVGGVDSYPIVAGALSRVSDAATYAEVSQIAGWVAADAGRPDVARRHYVSGVQAAAESGNRIAGANNLSSLAYLLAGSRDGVLLAEAAVRVRDMPATMMALVAERLAWASATAGEVEACLRALDRAEEAFTRRAEGAEPEATYWLSLAEMEIMRGRCYVEMQRPLLAVPLLERVTSEYSWSVRESALYLSYLAEAYAQANEKDAAQETLERARALAAGVHSMRVDDRLRS